MRHDTDRASGIGPRFRAIVAQRPRPACRPLVDVGDIGEDEAMTHDPLCEIASHPHLYPYAPHWCTCRQIMRVRTSQGWRAPEPENAKYRKFFKVTAH